jgi:hypothetical protein
MVPAQTLGLGMNAERNNRRDNLQRAFRTLGWTVIALFTVAVISRAVLVASKTDGGWQILGDHLTAGLPPSFSPPVSPNQSEIDSKKWLLCQANQVLRDTNSTASELMGAALVIQSSQFGRFDWRQPHAAGIGLMLWHQWPEWNDWGAELRILKTSLAFKMSQLASRAVLLEPANIEWRRMQAGMNWTWGEPAIVDQASLEAGRAVDPENALYDYLLGLNAFNKAFVTQSHPERGIDIVLKDLAAYRQSREHFSRAFTKRFLALGENGTECTAKFLQTAGGPVTLKVEVANADSFNHFRRYLFLDIQEPFYRDRPPPDDRRFTTWEELPIYLWFTVYDPVSFWQRQARAAGGTVALEYLFTQRWFIRSTAKESRYLMGRSQWEVDEQAANNQWRQDKNWSVFSIAASAALWLYAFLAVLALVMSAILGRSKLIATMRVNRFVPILIWFGSFIATFAVLGVVPSFVSKWNVQHPAVVVGAAAGVLLPIAVFFWFIARFVLRQGRLPSYERAYVYHVARLFLAICAGLASIAPLMIAVDHKVRSLVLRDLNAFPEDLLSSLQYDQLRSGRGTLPNAIAHWGMSAGLFWTAAIWVAILTILFWRRINRAAGAETADQAAASLRARLASWFRYIGRSAAPVAAIMFLICVAAATQWTVCVLVRYDRQLARLANPHWLADEVEAKAKELQVPLIPAQTNNANSADGSAEDQTP